MTHEDRIAQLERRVAELEAIVVARTAAPVAHGSCGYSYGPNGFGRGVHIRGAPYEVAIADHAHTLIMPDGTIASGGLTLTPVMAPETFRPSGHSAG